MDKKLTNQVGTNENVINGVAVEPVNEVKPDNGNSSCPGHETRAQRGVGIGWKIAAIVIGICLILAIAFIVISNVSTQGSNDTYKYGAASSDFEPAEEEYMVDADMVAATEGSMAATAAGDTGTWTSMQSRSSDSSQNVSSQSKIIYTVYMNMQTTAFDSAVQNISELITQYGAYCESEYLSNASSGYRDASYTIRVPAENLDAFLEQVGNVCTVTYMNRYAEDVSEYYYDTESRLTTAKTKLERLQELLKEAENMEDIIAIEEAITDVESDIDNYSGSIRYYDSQISYSTVTIGLSEVYEVTEEKAPLTFAEKISDAFSQGMKAFGDFMKNLVVWLAGSWIWIIIAVAVIVAAVIIICKCVKKKKCRSTSRLE